MPDKSYLKELPDKCFRECVSEIGAQVFIEILDGCRDESPGQSFGRPSEYAPIFKTGAALLESAATVFTKRGYDAATIEEIAEAAGYSRGGLIDPKGLEEGFFTRLLLRFFGDALGPSKGRGAS